MAIIQRLVRHLCTICMIGATTAITTLVLLILTEILLRSVFDSSLLVTEEFAGYLVSGAIILALAPTFHDGAMIRLTLLSDCLSENHRKVLELCMTLIALFVVLFWARYILRAALKLFDRGVTSPGVFAFPLWIPEGVTLFGLVSLAVVIFAHGLNLIWPKASVNTNEGAIDYGD
ncbi:TRAP transporter small permease [Amphritea opalescens]|nr:TRAP transporter small permease [Amphritea opalescens]